MAIKNGDLDYYDTYKKQILKRKGVVATPEEYIKAGIARKVYKKGQKRLTAEEWAKQKENEKPTGLFRRYFQGSTTQNK